MANNRLINKLKVTPKGNFKSIKKNIEVELD